MVSDAFQLVVSFQIVEEYPDAKDKPFLEAAVYVGGVLITNNVRDYPFAGVRILQVGEFLRFLEAF